MKRIQRHWPFLKSILQEANRFKRQEMLFHANADQINALSEVVMNFLKNKILIPNPSRGLFNLIKTR